MRQGTTQEIAEAAQLRKAVQDIQAILDSGTAFQGGASSILLASMLDQAKGRLAQLERDEKARERDERLKSVNELAIAYKAQQEAALSAAEQAQYSGFLEKEYFTRADFGRLDSFYTNTWDRLSEDGKAEMSYRVWEGVRRDEYKFNELPENVKQKEAERLQGLLSEPKKMPESLRQLPEKEKADFMKAMQMGKSEEAAAIMGRESFAQSVSVRKPNEQSAASNSGAIAAPLPNLTKSDGLKLE